MLEFNLKNFFKHKQLCAKQKITEKNLYTAGHLESRDNGSYGTYTERDNINKEIA